jgi:hypothetical protein
MSANADPSIRYKWSLDAIHAEHGACYSGGASKEMLSALFAMWLKDQGDVSDWAQAPCFGKIVHTYSTLSMPTIAVWLGIDEGAILDEPAPGTPPWEFHGPGGDLLELDRSRTVSD